MEQHCTVLHNNPTWTPPFHPHPESLNREDTQDLDNTSLRKRRKMLGNIQNLKKAQNTKTHVKLENMGQGKSEIRDTEGLVRRRSYVKATGL